MSWKTAYRSFYYATAEEPDDIRLDPDTTALLVVDIQTTYLEDKETPEETERWRPFFDHMRGTVIPNNQRLIAECRKRGVEVIFARIACQKNDGRDRSLSQKKPGFNYLLLPKDRPDGQIVPELAPQGDEIGRRQDRAGRRLQPVQRPGAQAVGGLGIARPRLGVHGLHPGPERGRQHDPRQQHGQLQGPPAPVRHQRRQHEPPAPGHSSRPA